VSALTEVGVTLDAGRAALNQVVGRLVPDADALRTLGAARSRVNVPGHRLRTVTQTAAERP
jgi:hypothetical protein